MKSTRAPSVNLCKCQISFLDVDQDCCEVINLIVGHLVFSPEAISVPVIQTCCFSSGKMQFITQLIVLGAGAGVDGDVGEGGRTPAAAHTEVTEVTGALSNTGLIIYYST